MKAMKVHNFSDDDLRILASLAIDFSTDDMEFKVIRIIQPEENYWSYDCRFALSAEELETRYDSLHIDCGRDNEPETYQMSWNQQRDGEFKMKPITSPLLVVFQFHELCKKQQNLMN